MKAANLVWLGTVGLLVYNALNIAGDKHYGTCDCCRWRRRQRYDPAKLTDLCVACENEWRCEVMQAEKERAERWMDCQDDDDDADYVIVNDCDLSGYNITDLPTDYDGSCVVRYYSSRLGEQYEKTVPNVGAARSLATCLCRYDIGGYDHVEVLPAPTNSQVTCTGVDAWLDEEDEEET